VKNKPAYAIESVDHALHLATVLQQEGAIGVTEAASLLGVSRSTAHRLLAMLVYRDFAKQEPDRQYHAGPVLRLGDAATTAAPIAELRRAALPHMRALVNLVGETANLQVRAGGQTRFIANVECEQILRVGDRAGRALPAHRSSGGKALLAALPPAELAELYPDAESDDPNPAKLRRELALIRKRGFAINNQLTETGVTAIGVVVPDTEGIPSAALALAIPTARFDRDQLPTWVGALSSTATAIAHDLY
jgi:DNA-binding IclR family transcriptional regulator